MPRNKNENEVARARLAYITAGQPIDTSAKRSLGQLEQAESDDDSDIDPAEPQPAVAQVSAAWAAKQLRSRYAIAVLVLLLLGVGVTILILTQSQASQVDLESPALQIAEPSQTSSTEPDEPVTIRVHVLGAVEKPGVVALEEGDIVSDALEASGGLN